MAQVDVINPQGEVGSVPTEQLESALHQGYIQASPEQVKNADLQSKYGTTGQEIRAHAEALARGATLGGSDIAATKLFNVPAADIAGRMQANPSTKFTQALGNVGLAAATGGAGELGAIAGPAVEGAALGAGNIATDYALGDPELSAQKIVSELGVGALLGGGLGAISKGVKYALPEAAQKLNDSVEELLPKFARGAEGLPEDISSKEVRAATKNLQEMYDAGKESLTALASPELESTIGPAQKNFEAAFMTPIESKSGTKLVIDPSKVESILSDPEAAGNDLARQHLDTYVSELGKVADAHQNAAGFEAADDSIKSKFARMQQEHEQQMQVARSLQGGINPTVTVPFTNLQVNPYMVGKALHTVSAAGKFATDAANRIVDDSKAVFSAASKRAIMSVGSQLSDRSYKQKVDQIQQLSNPDTLINHMDEQMGHLHEAMPNVTPHMQSTMQQGLQFLQSKIPQAPTQYPLDGKWEPTQAQKNQFSAYYNAVNDPISALKQVKNGTLSNETMEVLTQVYPRLLQEMRTELTTNMREPASYATKIALAKFMGQPLDSFQTPQSVQANQAAMSTPVQKMTQKITVNGSKGLQKLADRAKTGTQRERSDD